MLKSILTTIFKNTIQKLLDSARGLLIDDLKTIILREFSDDKINNFTATTLKDARAKLLDKIESYR